MGFVKSFLGIFLMTTFVIIPGMITVHHGGIGGHPRAQGVDNPSNTTCDPGCRQLAMLATWGGVPLSQM
jgi:hypothetical protein